METPNLTVMRKAMDEARTVQLRCDEMSGELAAMLVGRLRKVRNAHTLERLKRELANYNIQTGRWKP